VIFWSLSPKLDPGISLGLTNFPFPWLAIFAASLVFLIADVAIVLANIDRFKPDQPETASSKASEATTG
jgi:hypothetical protein